MSQTRQRVSRDPKRYEELAAFARANGYPRVTGPAVHSWVKAGLLPRAEVHHTGFGERQILEPEATKPQLLALCRHRFGGVRHLDDVGLLMWLEGLRISDERVRGGLRRIARAPERLLAITARRTDAADPLNPAADLEAAAVAVAYDHPLPEAIAQGIPSGDVAIGFADYLGLVLGRSEPSQVDPDDLGGFARLLGLDRAATDRLPDAAPWLPEPPGVALLGIAGALTPERLVSQINQATADDLAVARDAALRMVQAFAEAAGQLAALGRPDFAGFGVIGRAFSHPTAVGAAVLGALAMPSETAQFVAALPSPNHSG